MFFNCSSGTAQTTSSDRSYANRATDWQRKTGDYEAGSGEFGEKDARGQ